MGLLCCALPAWSADGYGKLTGVVIDPAGTPQMGATILLTAETPDGLGAARLLTDQEGVFSSVRLRPGLYSLRATLAGFLPTIQQHVRVSANLTTLVNIELDSVFTSLDQLRHPSGQASEKEDWKWVLRTSSASRPVLQLRDGTLVIADDNSENPELRRQDPHGLVQLTNGSSYPGSPSALPGALTTAVSYDQSLGPAGRLLIAGEMSYDHTSGYNPAPGGLSENLAGGLATIWIPSGKFGQGPQTTVVMHQARLPRGERSVRMMRARALRTTGHRRYDGGLWRRVPRRGNREDDLLGAAASADSNCGKARLDGQRAPGDRSCFLQSAFAWRRAGVGD